MRVAVVAEFYPRVADPVLGVWSHRQALATKDLGVDVEVIVLHRPVPPSGSLKDLAAWRRAASEPRRRVLDGVPVTTVRYLAPQRGSSYGDWGRYAAPQLRHALRSLGRFDLVHAHNAVPAADAALRAMRPGRVVPLVVSVHGGDVLWTALQRRDWGQTVRAALHSARLVLANSAGTADRTREHGARDVRVVHLGTDVPRTRSPDPTVPTLVTVAHLVSRKRHADVLRAMWLLRERHPRLRYRVVGDGPERAGLQRLAASLELAERVDFLGQLDPAAAVAEAQAATLFVLPSIDEAFGVAYVEAMAGGVPAIGAVGESGPQEIAQAGEGIVLVPPGDVDVLARELDRQLSVGHLRHRLGNAARATVQRSFTWEACGRATVAAYEEALRGRSGT